MGRLAMLMGGLGHAWAGSSATVAAVVARPLDFARPHVPEWAAESAAKPSCRGQPWVLGRSLPHYNPFM